MLATGGRGGEGGEVISKVFSENVNIFPDIIILPENNKIFQDIPKYKNKFNHKSKAIGQNMESERHFSRR
jgi:hypothetical protein